MQICWLHEGGREGGSCNSCLYCPPVRGRGAFLVWDYGWNATAINTAVAGPASYLWPHNGPGKPDKWQGKSIRWSGPFQSNAEVLGCLRALSCCSASTRGRRAHGGNSIVPLSLWHLAKGRHACDCASSLCVIWSSFAYLVGGVGGVCLVPTPVGFSLLFLSVSSSPRMKSTILYH